MRKEVTIQQADGEKITAGCDRSACEGCKGSLFCTSKKASFDVLNPDKIPLEKGDQAIIDLPPRKTLFTVFMSLGLPLIMFVPGYIIGRLLSENEGIQLLTSLLGVALGFVISAIFFRFNRKKYTPVVIDKKEGND